MKHFKDKPVPPQDAKYEGVSQDPVTNGDLDRIMFMFRQDTNQMTKNIAELRPVFVALKWIPIMIVGLLVSAFFGNVLQAINLMIMVKR